jgi:hypothetical protein
VACNLIRIGESIMAESSIKLSEDLHKLAEKICLVSARRDAEYSDNFRWKFEGMLSIVEAFVDREVNLVREAGEKFSWE